jgi:hypothetical protein
MKSLRRAVVVGWVALAACRTATHDAPAADPAPPPPGPQQVAGVQPEFLPAFEDLQRAVAAGDDVVARHILRGIMARSPTGSALSLAQAFERVLAGREAVSELHISLVARTAPNAATTVPSNGEQARMEARLVFVVENTSTVPIELRPGPANLRVTKTSVGRLKMVVPGEPMLGGEQQSSETHPYPQIRDLRLEPGRSVENELARFFIDVPEGDLAVRLTFDLELRSGSIVRDGRELPAMHVPVKACEATCWSTPRYPECQPTPEGLEQYVISAAPITADCALEIAVRMPPEERGRALDRLAEREREISETHLVQLGPALRWLTQDPTLGGDAELWRAYLRARTGAKTKERPKLELPVRSE